jgi:hypothetical protein
MAEGTDSRWAHLPDHPTKLTPEELEVADDLLWAAMDPELQKLYPDEFVAAYRRQVIAHGHDHLTVLQEAQRITGLPKHRIAITTILGPGLLFARH